MHGTLHNVLVFVVCLVLFAGAAFGTAYQWKRETGRWPFQKSPADPPATRPGTGGAGAPPK